MNDSVIDASALLAFLGDEEGSTVVEHYLSGNAFMSSVNWAEVLSKAADAGEDPEDFSKKLKEQGLIDGCIKILALKEEDALLIASLRHLTKKSGLSLADRACLALGMKLKLPVVTADQAWANLKLGIKIKCIR